MRFENVPTGQKTNHSGAQPGGADPKGKLLPAPGPRLRQDWDVRGHRLWAAARGGAHGFSGRGMQVNALLSLIEKFHIFIGGKKQPYVSQVSCVAHRFLQLLGEGGRRAAFKTF